MYIRQLWYNLIGSYHFLSDIKINETWTSLTTKKLLLWAQAKFRSRSKTKTSQFYALECRYHSRCQRQKDFWGGNGLTHGGWPYWYEDAETQFLQPSPCKFFIMFSNLMIAIYIKLVICCFKNLWRLMGLPGSPISVGPVRYSLCQRNFRIFYGLSGLTYSGAPVRYGVCHRSFRIFFSSFSYLGDPRLLVQKDEELTGKGPCKNA